MLHTLLSSIRKHADTVVMCGVTLLMAVAVYAICIICIPQEPVANVDSLMWMWKISILKEDGDIRTVSAQDINTKPKRPEFTLTVNESLQGEEQYYFVYASTYGDRPVAYAVEEPFWSTLHVGQNVELSTLV